MVRAQDAPEPPREAPAEEAPPSEAESPAIAEARVRIARAERLFDRDQFESAYQEYARIRALLEGHPLSSLAVYNMARCAEELERFDEAIGLYQAYLRAAPDGDLAAPARAKIETLESLLAVVELDVTQPPGPGDAPAPPWEVWLDGRRVGEGVARLRVSPGRHRVEVRARGYLPSTDEVEVASGDTRRVEVGLARPGGDRLPVGPFVVATIAGGLALVAGVALGGAALAETDALSRCADDDACRPTTNFDAGNARNALLAGAADVAFAVAGAAAVAAFVLAFYTDFENAPGATALAPWFTPDGGGLTARGAF